MDVSVIVATHNQQERLALVLEGLRHQSFPTARFEVIVVDDGCTDGTENLFKDRDFAFVRPVALRPNQGRCRARNAGIAQARGALAVFLDGDAVPDAELVAQYWQAFEATQGQAVLFGFHYCLPDVEPYQDPQTGTLTDRPLASFMRDYLALHRDERVVTREQVARGHVRQGHRVAEGIYPQPAVAAMQRQVWALFAEKPAPELGWLGFVPHSGAVPVCALRAVGGFDPDIPFCEGWELAYRLQRRGYPCRPVAGARSYHLYHYHGFADPARSKEEDRVRRRAIEYMARKHGDPRFRLLFLWFLSFAGGALLPQALQVRDVVAMEEVYAHMTPQRWAEYQAVLDRNPLLPKVPLEGDGKAVRA